MFPAEFTTHDGLVLNCTCEMPSSKDHEAAVVVVHGLGDHSQSLPYHQLAQTLLENDIAVFRFDLRGHGSSEGRRGHINEFSDFREDLTGFVNLVSWYLSGSKIHLLGMSMGGLIVLDQLIDSQVQISSAIAIAPALSADGAPKLVRFIVRALSGVLPRVYIDPGLDLDKVSRDGEAVKKYLDDPLFSTRMTIRMANEILNAVGRVNADASRISSPLLILHGASDTVVPPFSSEEFFPRVSSIRRKREVYPGALHNLLIETNRAEVYSDIIAWLKGPVELES